MISCLIITYNEEKHLSRCISLLKSISDDIVVVDSFSTDRTEEIAKSLDARFVKNEFVSHAHQINWAIDNIDFKNEFVFRVDADEYITKELEQEIRLKVQSSVDYDGFYLRRRTYFLGRWIKYGGYYPTTLLRIWRKNHARCELRAMDEHMVLTKGDSCTLDNDFIDENLSSLSEWTIKHNKYSCKELVEYNKMTESQGERLEANIGVNNSTRILKRKYYKSPIFLRSFAYFIYRYFFKLGFLDGTQGLIYHFLQGFWYRFLVDAKIYEQEVTNDKHIKAR